MPGLWSAATQEERQTLVRLLLERVLVDVVNGTEQVKVMCHWHGGHRTVHQLVRPVARLDRLSTYHGLLARTVDLRRAGQDYAAIAEVLNQEGWRPAKRRDTFNASMVRNLLRKTGLEVPQYRRPPIALERRPDEWTIAELARHLPVPEPTLYSWVQRRRLPSRTVRVRGRQLTLLYADEAAIATLRAVRDTPQPWRRLPRSITAASDPARVHTSGES